MQSHRNFYTRRTFLLLPFCNLTKFMISGTKNNRWYCVHVNLVYYLSRVNVPRMVQRVKGHEDVVALRSKIIRKINRSPEDDLKKKLIHTYYDSLHRINKTCSLIQIQMLAKIVNNTIIHIWMRTKTWSSIIQMLFQRFGSVMYVEMDRKFLKSYLLMSLLITHTV